MRIAIVLASDFVEGNGANSRIKAFAKGLKEQGQKVDLLFLHASSFNETGINKDVAGYWNGIYFKFLNGKCRRPRTLAGKIWDTLVSLFASAFFFLRNHKKYDVLYLYGPKLYQNFPIFFLRWILGLKIVIERTELRSALFENRKGLVSSLLFLFHRIDERCSQYFCDHMIVISSGLMDHYRRFFSPEKITLIPIVVDFSRFAHLNGEPRLHKRIGYLGSCHEKDGIEGIINAFSRAEKDHPGLKLRIIGYDQEGALSKMPRLGLLNGSVEYIGQVKHDDIPDLLYECDLLVVNRVNTKYASFGFPTKLGEYLATGKPTVISRVGDVNKYLVDRESALFVEPGNDDHLANIFSDRYSNIEFFNRIGENGKRICFKVFNYEKYLPLIISILDSVKSP